MKGPKNGIVRVSFSGCPGNERRQFNQSHAMLLISVGQPYHEDEKFEATLELINRSFKSCTILVADLLQRHNIVLENNIISLEHAYDIAKQRGDAWLSRNQSAIGQLDIPWTIQRWSHYLSHPHYLEQKHFMDAVSEREGPLQNALQHSVIEYLNRLSRRHDDSVDIITYHDHCLEYLKEECAIMCLWPRDVGHHYEVYPTPRNQAMTVTYEQFIKPQFPKLLKPVALRFKRYRQEQVMITPQYGQQAVFA